MIRAGNLQSFSKCQASQVPLTSMFWTAAARCRFGLGSLLPRELGAADTEWSLNSREVNSVASGRQLKIVQQQAVGQKAAAGCRSPGQLLDGPWGLYTMKLFTAVLQRHQQNVTSAVRESTTAGHRELLDLVRQSRASEAADCIARHYEVWRQFIEEFRRNEQSRSARID